jgi:hypothetical protein
MLLGARLTSSKQIFAEIIFFTYIFLDCESPRVLRRPQPLRGWSYEQINSPSSQASDQLSDSCNRSRQSQARLMLQDIATAAF